MIFDGIEWDENNLDHACRRVTAAEIEEFIAKATSYRQHRYHPDRVLLTGHSDGNKRVTGRRPLRHRPPPHPANYRHGRSHDRA